jgi:23S rRNA (uracil1939-C5)-methyltransferase
MLTRGDQVDVTVEKAAAGGRMIARHEGQVLLVAGVIPGERASVRIDRVEKRLAFASAVHILEPSPDRRAAADPLCGGCVFAHIHYARQVALKAEIVADAFARIGRTPLASAIRVAPSPEEGYRMRARLHVRDGRAGFFREGTHELCDARATRQMTAGSMDAVDALLRVLGDERVDVQGIEVSENVAGDQRAVHVDLAQDARAWQDALTRAVAAGRLTGCSARGQLGPFVAAGDPAVADPLSTLTAGRAAAGELRRRPVSFFQGNRFVLPALVTAVLDVVPADRGILDLYAGVGLFSAALAATGRTGITAVEGDRDSGGDLKGNAAAFAHAVRAIVGRVEDQVTRGLPRAETVVVDPPRTGISREAMDAIVQHGASRIVYVSCDPPTMARDARRLLDAGYALQSLEGFDFFPNTPHIETLGVFSK